MSKADDAGVYKLNDEFAVVQTVDFIAPVVEDPYSFGMIAAANALSDVYTMGGKPVTAMNVVCFPCDKLDIDILARILAGALSKLTEAGVTLVGGHSVNNVELKYGLSVTGIINPQKVITSSGARPGDKLILTKPLGIGIMSTALKAGLTDSDMERRLTEQMAQLNRDAADIMVSLGVNACTDITGFGLIGHTFNMAKNSGVTIELFADKIPLIDEAIDFARTGLVPHGAYSNRSFYTGEVEKNDITEELMDVFYDPQTSGGLLIAVPLQKANETLSRIKQTYNKAAVIGQVLEKKGSHLILK